MYLQPATTVGFHRHLDRLVDDPDRGADGNKTKQGFDVIRAQPDTTRADSQTDPEILVGAVDEVVLVAIAKTHGELAEGIVGAGGDHGGQIDPLLLQPGLADHGAGHPGRVGIFRNDGGGHLRRLAADVTDPDGQHHHLLLALGEVVEAKFRQVDDDAFSRHVGQQHLGRQSEPGARGGQIGVYAGIGFEQCQKACPGMLADQFQMIARLYDVIFQGADETAVRWRQGIGVGPDRCGPEAGGGQQQ